MVWVSKAKALRASGLAQKDLEEDQINQNYLKLYKGFLGLTEGIARRGKETYKCVLENRLYTLCTFSLPLQRQRERKKQRHSQKLLIADTFIVQSITLPP